MSDSARKNRRSKVDVIVLDDDEPQVKSPRKAQEPLPSSEVTELQQKLAKAEKRIERLIKIAGDAQSRVEFLESLIDKKPNIKEEPKKAAEAEGRAAELELELQKERKERIEERERGNDMISSLKQQLDQERATAAAAVKKAEDSAASAAALNLELYEERKGRSEEREKDKEMISSLKQQLDQERATAAAAVKKAEDSAASAAEVVNRLEKALEEKREEMLEKVEEERRAAAADRKRAIEERTRDHERIDQLTAQLDQCKGQTSLHNSDLEKEEEDVDEDFLNIFEDCEDEDEDEDSGFDQLPAEHQPVGGREE